MNWFTRENEEMVRRQEEKNHDFRKQLEEEIKAEREEYIAELEKELAGEDTTIITLHIEDDECGWLKQIALNFMFKHDYVCVQNSISYSAYNDQYYDLTFVKKEYADFFRCW